MSGPWPTLAAAPLLECPSLRARSSITVSAQQPERIPIPLDGLEPAEVEARARIAVRDPDDWPTLAAALLLECPIWTEDRDFFGSGVATWTTATVERYLREPAK